MFQCPLSARQRGLMRLKRQSLSQSNTPKTLNRIQSNEILRFNRSEANEVSFFFSVSKKVKDDG